VDIYIKPYSRVQTYLVGTVLGYFLHKTRGKGVHISRPVRGICWLLSTGTCMAVVYGIYPWYNPHFGIPRIAGALFAGFHRIGFGISMAWIILACVKGYGGIINKFLSWSAFIPLGRLCFSVYLVSLSVLMKLHLGFKQPITYDVYTIVSMA